MDKVDEEFLEAYRKWFRSKKFYNPQTMTAALTWNARRTKEWKAFVDGLKDITE